MRTSRHHAPHIVLFTLLACLVLAAATAQAHPRRKPTKKHTAQPALRELPVTFSVVNDNTSDVPCTGDGKTYTVTGTLALPAGAVPSGVTLYVHGLGYGAYFWHFTAVPGYDYITTEAKDGHASVAIDRLGYGSSSIPNGTKTCVGSQATILHEIDGDLRDGAYHVSGLSTAPTFSRVGLVGHSAGGELAEIEADSYNDIDALGVVEWNDADYSVGTYDAFGADVTQCATGGEDQVGSSSAGYAAFGETDAEYNALMFAGATAKVIAAADSLRTLDPCDQIETTLNGVGVDLLHVGSIKVPIAYVHASEDAIFPIGVPWASVQEKLYSDTSKLTDISLPGAGHAVTLEANAAAPFAAAMNRWLTANGL